MWRLWKWLQGQSASFTKSFGLLSGVVTDKISALFSSVIRGRLMTLSESEDPRKNSRLATQMILDGAARSASARWCFATQLWGLSSEATPCKRWALQKNTSICWRLSMTTSMGLRAHWASRTWPECPWFSIGTLANGTETNRSAWSSAISTKFTTRSQTSKFASLVTKTSFMTRLKSALTVPKWIGSRSNSQIWKSFRLNARRTFKWLKLFLRTTWAKQRFRTGPTSRVSGTQNTQKRWAAKYGITPS